MALRRDDAWARRVARMVGVSTAAHVVLFAAVLLVGTWLATRRPQPIIAYSVELTDLPGTGGRLPAGPGKDLIGRSPAPPAAAKASSPAASPPAPPPHPAEPAVAKPLPPKEAAPTPPEPKPEAKVEPKPEPKPEPKKVEPKAEPKKVAIKPVEPAKAAVPPKPTAKVEPKKEPPKAVPETKPAPTPTVEKPPPAEPQPAAQATAKPAPEAKPSAGATAASSSAKTAAPADDYASAAQRFRDRMAAAGTGAGAPGAGVAGGGPGGGVLGSGGDGRGGGQVKSLEWVAYRQRVINAVKERWSNAISRPGLIAKVRFRIALDGTVSDVQLEQSSGNAVYDQTAVAAVERVTKLPPPPAAYVNDFREFHMNFFGDEMGGVSG